MVPDKVYEHYKGLTADSFNGSQGFVGVLDDACKAFVNSVPRAPEWLARHAHSLLDKVDVFCFPSVVICLVLIVSS